MFWLDWCFSIHPITRELFHVVAQLMKHSRCAEYFTDTQRNQYVSLKFAVGSYTVTTYSCTLLGLDKTVHQNHQENMKAMCNWPSAAVNHVKIIDLRKNVSLGNNVVTPLTFQTMLSFNAIKQRDILLAYIRFIIHGFVSLVYFFTLCHCYNAGSFTVPSVKLFDFTRVLWQ